MVLRDLALVCGPIGEPFGRLLLGALVRAAFGRRIFYVGGALARRAAVSCGIRGPLRPGLGTGGDDVGRRTLGRTQRTVVQLVAGRGRRVLDRLDDLGGLAAE